MFDLSKQKSKINVFDDHHSDYQGLAENKEQSLPLVYSGLDGASIT